MARGLCKVEICRTNELRRLENVVALKMIALSKSAINSFLSEWQFPKMSNQDDGGHYRC